MSPLESKHFIASPTDVAVITKAVLDARLRNTGSRADYFKALLATTQAALGVAPRQRQVTNPTKIPEKVWSKHLAALEEQNKIFYDEVVKTTKEFLGPNYDPDELQSSTGFARSSVSTLRTWIRAGNDITDLVAAKTKKSELGKAAKKQKRTSPRVLSNRVRKHGDRFQAAIAKVGEAKLAEADAAAVRENLEAVKASIQQTLDKLNGGRKIRASVSSSRGLHAPA